MSVVHQPGNEPPAELSPAEAVSGPTVLRMILGSKLRQLREAAGVSPEQAGYEIRASRSKISRVEHGRVSFKERDVLDLLTLYGVTDEKQRNHMLALAQQANNQGWWAKFDDLMPDWFETFVGLEQATSLIRAYEVQLVPGLFQTEAYARAVMKIGFRGSPADEIERRVSFRMSRQQILDRPEGEPRIWAIIDESALRRALGGPDVMREQLGRLIEVAEMPQVSLQVMPFDRPGQSPSGGAFEILRFAESDLPDVVYLEQLTSALYLDRPDEVDHYREVMNSLSAEAETPAESQARLKKIIDDL